MKKLIFALLTCLIAATTATAAGNREGYRLTQEWVESNKSGCDYTTDYLQNLIRDLRGNDVYDQRVRAQVIAGRLPGANINNGGGGTMNVGDRVHYFNDYTCFATEISGGSAVTEKYDFRQRIYTINGPGGSAAVNYGGGRPQIIQASLPDMADAAAELIGKGASGEAKGYSYKQNATVELLQLAYDEDFAVAYNGYKANAIQAFLYSAITSTKDRQDIFNSAVKLLKSGGKNPQAANAQAPQGQAYDDNSDPFAATPEWLKKK